MTRFLQCGWKGRVTVLVFVLFWPVSAWVETLKAVTVGRDLFTLAVSHQQGWGRVGLDTAAYAPGTQPVRLRIGPREYEAGLGVHAPAVTVLALDGTYRMFEAEAGVQWQGGTGTGTVIMSVLVDGKKVFDSGPLREGDAPVPVRVSVEGAWELRLEVADAGDGITCDMANWATVRLEPDPQAVKQAADTSVDIAPFARLLSWDPARKEGTRATRLETMSVEDLYPDQAVQADPDGRIRVPVYPDGRSCVGLEWLERRRPSRLELVYPDDRVPPDAPAVEYWLMPEAGSRWQGAWHPLPGHAEQAGGSWRFHPDWSAIPEGTLYGTLEVRFIFPPDAGRIFLKQLRAFSRCRYADAVLRVFTDTVDLGASGAVEVYNGALADSPDLVRTWRLGEPLELRVTHANPASWQMVEQTVLRFRLPTDAFGVAVRDVLEQGMVYVPHASLLVADASKPVPDISEVREQTEKGRTTLDRVRTLPEQTLEQAMSKTALPGLVTAPTMLSLACDNRKWVVSRNGSLQFEDDPSVYNHVAGIFREPACLLEVLLEDEDPNLLRRGLEDGQWYPIVHIERGGNRYRVENRVFVAPWAPAEAGRPKWWRDRVMGVSAFTFRPEPGAAVHLNLKFGSRISAPVTISRNTDDRVLLVRHGTV